MCRPWVSPVAFAGSVAVADAEPPVQGTVIGKPASVGETVKRHVAAESAVPDSWTVLLVEPSTVGEAAKVASCWWLQGHRERSIHGRRGPPEVVTGLGERNVKPVVSSVIELPSSRSRRYTPSGWWSCQVTEQPGGRRVAVDRETGLAASVVVS